MLTPRWLQVLFPSDTDESAKRYWRITVSLAILAGVSYAGYGMLWASDKDQRIENLEIIVERIDGRLGRLETSSDRNLELSLVTAIRGLVEIRCRTTNRRDIAALETAIDRHMTEYRTLTNTFFPRPACPEQPLP